MNRTETSTPPELATVGQVAEMLQLSERTVWRMTSTGDLPRPLRFGRAARWRRETILARIREMEEKNGKST